MMYDLSRVKYLFNKAKEEKDKIKPVYNSILELTDPFSRIKDEGKLTLESMREDVDSEVLSSIDALCSYIMSSVLTKNGQFASLDLNELKLKEMYGEENYQKIYDEVNAVLDQDIARTFNYIQNSNYYEEISKAIKDFVVCGTGCYSIRETGITSTPFLFEYVGLDNLFILNDNFSRPNIVFKKHAQVNAEYLKDVFGSEIILKEITEEEFDKSIDVYECVVPIYDETTALTKYMYIVCDNQFSDVYLEKELEYNPFVVFLWNTVQGTSWGVSIVLTQKNLLKDLNKYKAMFQRQATLIANPPRMFIGNAELFDSLSLDEGSLNYGGDVTHGDVPPQISTIGSSQNLMPLDKVIQELLARFKNAIMVTHLQMNIDDTKYSTATAMQILHETFRRRFANTYELINEQLINPTFLSPFIIMLKTGVLSLKADVLPYVAVKYVSELTKASNSQNVNKVVNYMNVANQVQQLNQNGVLINLAKTLPYISDMLEIPKDLVPSESDIQEVEQAKREQIMMQMQQQQMMAEQGVAPQEVPQE